MSNLEPLEANASDEIVRIRFRDWILDPAFACVGAKSAVKRDNFRLEVYDRMCGRAASEQLARDLTVFIRDQNVQDSAFSTFAASFRSPELTDEQSFEALLWEQLQELHIRDSAPWDADVSSDPADSTFAFSFAGRAFFVVGLHPAASRLSRRFQWPTLVFNARFQFERLRERGQYARMQQSIRGRDRVVQGSENPMLSDFGTRSEARQYSGRLLEDNWICPFRSTTHEAR